MMTQYMIVMAVYNNAQFIRQQLDSILRQTVTDWRLLARDDGSTDGTREILQEYAAKDERIECLYNDSAERGAYVNFHHLIRIAKIRRDYRYLVLSDADDVWRDDRLARLMDAARRAEEDDCPRFYYSSFAIMDANGNVRVPDQSVRMDLRMESRWALLFHRDKVWGCTGMANRALIDKIAESPELDIRLVAHDAYLANYALVYGECVYLNEPLVYYRRHGGNASGFSHGGPLRTLSRVFDSSQARSSMAATFKQSIATIDEMLIKDPDNTDLVRIRRLLLRGGVPAAWFCVRARIRRFRWDKTLVFYTLLLTGGYRRDALFRARWKK